MKLQRIECENFRGFERLSIDLDPELTLVVGANGSGKSSLLEAIALALSSWFCQWPLAHARPLEEDDARRLTHIHKGIVTLAPVFPLRVTAEGMTQGVRVTWKRFRQELGSPPAEDLGQLQSLASAAQQRAMIGQPIALPVLAWYGAGRSWCSTGRRHVVGNEMRLFGYDACMDPVAEPAFLEAWMRWRETVRLQQVAAGVPPEDIEAPELEAVQRAVCGCVPGAKRFRYDFAHEELRCAMDDGRELPLRLLADGTRNLLRIAADIACRAAMLNPHLGRDAAIMSEGVVLIDEIDRHLHPRWQRLVLPSLRAAFPKIQFIATTQSPQVVSSARGAWVRVLDPKGGVHRVQHAEGRDSNAILEDIFGTSRRPEQVNEEIAELFASVDRRAFVDARERLVKLEGLLGRDDADVVRARRLLEQDEPGE